MRPTPEEITRLLKEEPDSLVAMLEGIHAEDLADIISALEPDDAADLLELFPVEEAAPIFERLDEHDQGQIAEHLPPESVAQIASEMAPDDRADLFSGLPEKLGDEILEDLEKIDPEAAEDVRQIEKYPETSAGHLMTTNYIEVGVNQTVEQALGAIRAFAADTSAPVYNVYVMSENRESAEYRDSMRIQNPNAAKIEGVVSLRQLILSSPFRPIREIVRPVVSVTPLLDQEEVARQMSKYDLNEMAVVDEAGSLLGIITLDDIIDVLTQEQTEDAQKLGAVEPLEAPYFRTTLPEFVRKRGVWLLVLFIGGSLTQAALKHYDPVFTAIHGAVYYVPFLVSAGGNSGSQSSTLVIRGMALGEIKTEDWFRVLKKELVIGLVLGLGLAAVGYVRVLMYADSTHLFAATVSITLVGIVLTGCTIGAMLPLAIKRVGLDPATSSTPFIASLVDVAGIIVFVHVAMTVMASVLRGHVLP